jgi:hypothetical protein
MTIVSLKIVSPILLCLLASVKAYDKEALGNWFMGLKPEKVVYAINCGSSEDMTDLNGVTFKAVSIYY